MITLDSLKKSVIMPYVASLYGTQGIGKTSLITTCEQPVIIAAEQGLTGLAGNDYFEIKQYSDLIESLVALYGKHKFTLAAIDTVSAVEPFVHAKLLEDTGKTSLDLVANGFFQWRMEALKYWRDIIAAAKGLRDKKGMNVVFIAHSTDKEVNPPDQDPYRKYTIDLLNPRATELLYKESDIVAFCNYETFTQQTGVKGKKGQEITKQRAVGVGARKIYFEERPAFYAKKRYEETPIDAVMDKGMSFESLVNAPKPTKGKK